MCCEGDLVNSYRPSPNCTYVNHKVNKNIFTVNIIFTFLNLKLKWKTNKFPITEFKKKIKSAVRLHMYGGIYYNRLKIVGFLLYTLWQQLFKTGGLQFFARLHFTETLIHCRVVVVAKLKKLLRPSSGFHNRRMK